jgi:hypothetical protein
MTRRLARALLAAALIIAGVVVGPCTGNASCPMFRLQQMDCCKAPPAGISAPRCCDDAPQMGRNVAPATADRPAHRALHAPAMPLVTLAAPSAPTETLRSLRVDPAAAPPGGTLIAQHTSLLL